MKPNILINATMLNDPSLTGLGVHSLEMLRELLPLLRSDSQVERIRLLGERERLKELLDISAEDARLSIGHIRTRNPIVRLWLLNLAVRRWSDPAKTTFYSPTHQGVILVKTTQVVTIHDLFARLFPENYRLQSLYFQWYVPRLLRDSRAVISVSDNTGRDIQKFYGPIDKVKTVYNGLPRKLTRVGPETVKTLDGLRFFLSVGPTYSYKNADRLIDAYQQFRKRYQVDNFRLVLAGGRRPYLDFLRSHIEHNAREVKEEIVFLGYVPEGELAWLYREAVAIAITSLYEGFGLPALEAMHFGCPVIASNVGALPEVCGEAALFVDPYDTEDIARALQQVTVDRQLGNRLTQKGKNNLNRFSWDIAARQVHEILRSL